VPDEKDIQILLRTSENGRRLFVIFRITLSDTGDTMDIKSLLVFLQNIASGDSAWNHTAEIYSRDRWSSSHKYRESAQYCADALSLSGIRNSETIPFPADGRTKFGDWMMPLAWDINEARLEIDFPLVASCDRLLAQWSEISNSLIMWSAPTPSSGVEAELVVLKEGSVAEVESLDIRGKIVFTSEHPTGIKSIVSQKGGVGIVSDWLRAKDKPDAVQWINTWSDSPGGWGMHAHDSRLWGFSISPRKGEFLRELAAKGRVELKATVDTDLYEGELCYATGSIRGETHPDEEVVLTAHINEQGANDNASGAAVFIESARIIQKLIASGELPSPRRTIRFLMMPESYGLMAFAMRNLDKLRRSFAAINVDGGAGDHDSRDSGLAIYSNPLCCRSFADEIIAGIARIFYEEVKECSGKLTIRKYTLAGDNFLCEPLIGVPHTWLEMGAGGDYWHNSEDTLDKVDPRSLRDLSVVTAGCAYLLASAGRNELMKFAHQAFVAFPDEAKDVLSMSVPQMRQDDGKRPKRNIIGALTLDGIPQSQWKVVKSSPRWWSQYLAAWWWADGKHTIGQISQLLEDEFGKTPDDLEEFFDFLFGSDYLLWEC
jgi:uncharacterized protein DUF4910